jgi:hypothetical protein
MSSLDIVVIPGNDMEELFTTVRLLEPGISFLTVAAPNRAPFEAGLAAIADETGLSVNISADFRHVLKNAELIINFEDTSVITRYRMNPKSLIINLYGPGKSKIAGENTVINGVEYELPERIINVFGRDVLHFFGKKEIADIFICHELGLYGDFVFNELIEQSVRSLFNEKGMTITGFSGRRGVLRVENVLKAVRM